MPDYPFLDEEQSKEVMLDTNDFVIGQLSSTPFHVRLGLTFLDFSYKVSFRL